MRICNVGSDMQCKMVGSDWIRVDLIRPALLARADRSSPQLSVFTHTNMPAVAAYQIPSWRMYVLLLYNTSKDAALCLVLSETVFTLHEPNRSLVLLTHFNTFSPANPMLSVPHTFSSL